MISHVFSPPSSGQSKNRLLAALPADEYNRLAADLTSVAVERKQVLYKQGALVTDVYFPSGGLFSITTAMADGGMVECATVGFDGMLGVECLIREGATAVGETFLQIPNSGADRMSVEALRTAMASSRGLRDLLGRYLQFAIGQMMQTGSCNALHSVQERACRWILLAHDRVRDDEFLLSQEFLGMMLGTRRQTVAVTAAQLQAAGYIRYRHGRMTILDRKGLQESACECYQVLRRQYDELLK